jgi:hypothetical protein
MRKSAHTVAEGQIRLRYREMKGALTERARRLFVASEAMALGYGGIAAASRATGLAASVTEPIEASGEREAPHVQRKGRTPGNGESGRLCSPCRRVLLPGTRLLEQAEPAQGRLARPLRAP